MRETILRARIPNHDPENCPHGVPIAYVVSLLPGVPYCKCCVRPAVASLEWERVCPQCDDGPEVLVHVGERAAVGVGG